MASSFWQINYHSVNSAGVGIYIFGNVFGDVASANAEFAAGVGTVDGEATRIGGFSSFIYGQTFGALFQYAAGEINSAETGLPQNNSGLEWYVPYHNGQ